MIRSEASNGLHSTFKGAGLRVLAEEGVLRPELESGQGLWRMQEGEHHGLSHSKAKDVS